jgi:hypothetical protein
MATKRGGELQQHHQTGGKEEELRANAGNATAATRQEWSSRNVATAANFIGKARTITRSNGAPTNQSKRSDQNQH